MPSRAPENEPNSHRDAVRTYRTMSRPLPGRALSAAMIVHGELWIIVDPSKEDALDHARKMLLGMSLPPMRELVP
jgi:hypothetical protein